MGEKGYSWHEKVKEEWHDIHIPVSSSSASSSSSSSSSISNTHDDNTIRETGAEAGGVLLKANVPDAVVPPGLHILPDFFTEDDVRRFMDIIAGREGEQEGQQQGHGWKYRGFQEKRRVQIHTIASSSSSSSSRSPSKFDWMVDKLMKAMEALPMPMSMPMPLPFKRPNEIIIEEMKPTSFVPHRCNRFESATKSTCNECICTNASKDVDDENSSSSNNNNNNSNSCSCYVAELSFSQCVQSIDRPKEREAECWDLSSPQHRHGYNFIMPRNTLFVKTGECVWNWRSRTFTPLSMAIAESDSDSSGVGSGVGSGNGLDEKNETQDTDATRTTPTARVPIVPTYTIKFRKTVDNDDDHTHSRIRMGSSTCARTTCGSSSAGPSTSTSTSGEEEKKEETSECDANSSADKEAVEMDVQEKGKNKHLSKLLTIIVTTSPIKSNPSTELLERTFDTFHHGGEEFASCEKIIVCDGCRILQDEEDEGEEEKKESNTEEGDSKGIGIGKGKGDASHKRKNKVSKKYQNAKQALRNGIATNTQAENYRLFKLALNKICEDASGDKSSPFYNTRVVELQERYGYGFALRHALYHEVTTPYVCVIQHDRTFMRTTPMKEVVNAMMNKRVNGDIKYVGINMRSNLNYRDIFTSKYGKDALNELLDMVILPPELALNAETYGPDQSSMIDKIEGTYNAGLKRNLESLARSYLHGSIQYRSHRNQLESAQADVKEAHQKCQLSLTPTLFWYDNTHICETSHYRDFIFNPKYKMVARGGFVEDKLSPVITKSVERLGLREGHGKFSCYLLDDHSGFFFTGHLDGGSFMTKHEKKSFTTSKK